MDRPMPPSARADRTLPAPHPVVIGCIAILWLVFACGMPMRQVRAARRQGRDALQHALTTPQADKMAIMAAFDRSVQDVDAAASGPCLILAAIIIFLIQQLLKVKRAYTTLEHERRVYRNPEPGSGEAWTH